MAVAVEAAKAHQLRTGATWSASLSVALTAAWQAAKVDRLSRVREHALVEQLQKAPHRLSPQLIREEGEGSDVRQSHKPSPSPLTHSPLGSLARSLLSAVASQISTSG